jgi:YaiO family outer membrane protein
LEEADYLSKMKGFLFKANKNHVDVEYMQSRFSELDVITSVASVGYSRIEGDNTYSARLNYSGRNGSLFWNDAEATDSVDGGTGLQLIVGATRKINKKWTATANVGIGGSYFPKFIINGGASYYFGKDWSVDGSIGYRRLRGDKNLFSLSATLNKELPLWYLSAGGGLINFDSEMFFNLQAKVRYTPLSDGRTSITAAAGVGTAPELNIIDLYSLQGSFSHMNSFASLGGQYLITPNLSIGLLGVWNTIYDQKLAPDGSVATQYRNLYNTHVQIYISF